LAQGFGVSLGGLGQARDRVRKRVPTDKSLERMVQRVEESLAGKQNFIV